MNSPQLELDAIDDALREIQNMLGRLRDANLAVRRRVARLEIATALENGQTAE